MIREIVKGIKGHSPWLCAAQEKFGELTLVDAVNIHFRGLLALNEVNIKYQFIVDCGYAIGLGVYFLVKAQPFDFVKRNVRKVQCSNGLPVLRSTSETNQK